MRPDQPESAGGGESSGPGAALKAGRERAKLSVTQVARALRLPSQLVEALERDDFAALPERTYVRGYVRAYARLLALDERPLLASLEAARLHEPDPVGNLPARPLEPRQFALGWLGSAALVLVAAGLGAWSLAPSLTPWAASAPSAPIAENQASGRESPPEARTPGVPPDGAPSGASEAGLGAAAAPGIAQDLRALRPLLHTVQTNPAASGEASPAEHVAARTSPASSAARGTSPGQDKAPPESQTSAQSPPPASATGADRLTLRFDADSWAEVYDANKTRLVYGLVDSGNTRQVRGQAPFSVLLGNSEDIHVSINGQPFDQSRFVRSNRTARFSVSPP